MNPVEGGDVQSEKEAPVHKEEASDQRQKRAPAKRTVRGGWTEDQDQLLTSAVHQYNARNWKKIADFVPGKSDVQCLHRWQKVLRPDLVKGSWSKEEDNQIIELVKKQGTKKWSEIAKSLPGRIGKQCRERWHNHLKPDIKKTAWIEEEELIIIRFHRSYGNRWAELAKFLPGRTENAIKNHWNCSLKKKAQLLSYMLFQTPDRNMSSEQLSLQLNSSKHTSDQQQEGLDRIEGTNLSSSTADSRCPDMSNSEFPNPETHDYVKQLPCLGNEDNSGNRKTEALEDNMKGISSGFLWYKPVGEDDLKTGVFPSTDIYVQSHLTSPASNPAKENVVDSRIPESIWRSLGRSFRNTPSIIRKRKV